MTQFTDSKELIESINQKRQVIAKQIYRHFKGGLYIVEDVAMHSETGDPMVIYRSLKTGDLWVRPKEMFMGIKETPEGYVFRFKICGNAM